MGKTLIITEKQMNELKEILSEGISHVVYHFTSLQALYRILMTQKFYLKTGVFRDSYEHKLSDGKRMYYLSTTRNKNANEGYSNGYKTEGAVRISLDGEKLSHNYKGVPTNYWGDDSALGRMKYLNPDKVGQPLKWDKDMQQHRNDETEDRIWSFHPTIPNVMNYIKRVDILLPNENVISDYENRIVKAQQDGKDALVKSFQNSIENRKEEERHLKSIVYEIYNLIDRRGILFLYDNENDFIMGNSHTVKPEWLSNNDFYKDYKERQSVYSQQFNYKTNNALFNMLTSALAIMVYNERHENRKKRIIEYCKQYGFQNMLSQNLFTKVDNILYRNSNIFDISRDIDDNLFTNDEDASRVKDMVTHWMRRNGYRNLRNVVGEGKEITKVRQGMIAYESNEPDYEIGFEEGDLCPYAHVVTESQADSLRKYILLEDKRTKQAMNRTRQVIREHFNNEPWLDDVFNHQDNPKGLTYLEYMLEQFINEFYHNPQMRAGQTMRLMPLFCKLAFEFNFQNNNPDIANLNRLRSILNHLFVLSQKGEDLSKISLDMSFDELNNRYGTVIDVEAQAEKERMANAEYTENEEYTVIGPVDFETAQKYGNESCPDSKLCYTQYKQTWDNYTSNGLNNAYIILKDGWENISPQHAGEDNSPYDEYGLSMIFVFVDGEGDLVYCNTRWNHRADYPSPFSCDHAMSREMISELIGRRFELVFKPNTIWKDKITQIIERLSNGESPHNLFDWVDNFYEGFARVKIDNKYNFINTEGQIISNQWFDEVYYFYEGLAIVRINVKYNFINTEGQFISNQWFDWTDDVYGFNKGFAKVEIGGKSNFINTEGQFISNQWFDWTDDVFEEGFVRVGIDNKSNFINTEGQFISNQWFDMVYNFEEGFARVGIDNKSNFINTEGQIISNQWFDEVYNFEEGFARVKIGGIGGKYNFINTEGQIISNQWFDMVYNFYEGFARVKIGGIDAKYNFINTEGQFISNQWFDMVYNFEEGFARVGIDNKYNFINTEGQIISNQWFDWIDGDFYEGFAKVRIGGKCNFINTEGQFISNQWFDWTDDGFRNGYARVEIGGKYNLINTEGQFIFNQWADRRGITFYYNTLPSRTNENKKYRTLIITEEQAKRLQRYLMEETNPEDVDLSSFEIKDKLNPKFWKNNKLDSRIRLKLLDIADDFVDSLNIKWVDPEDITMTGSLANYTWNEEHSDIDLHIIMDYKKVDDKTDFVKNYFDAKKKEWNNKHSEIKIFGFPIEIYVQDKNEPHKSSGVYSLEKNEWITKPNRKNFSENDYDDNTVKKTVSDYMNQIDDIEEKFKKVEDLYQTEDIYDEAEEVFDNIKNERKNAFKKSNKELSTGNVIFKTLRRNGYIEKISNLKDKSYNKINSLS